MRKRTIVPVIALGALTLGTSSTALPASASMQHSVRFGEDSSEGTGTTQTTTGSSSSSTPSGGVSTGGGGMAGNPMSNPNVALWIATGGAGLALIGTGLVARRRRLDLATVGASSSSNTAGS